MADGEGGSSDVSSPVVEDGAGIFADEWKDVRFSMADVDSYLKDDINLPFLQSLPPENFTFPDNLYDLSALSMDDLMKLTDADFQIPPPQQALITFSGADFNLLTPPPPPPQQIDLNLLPPFLPQLPQPERSSDTRSPWKQFLKPREEPPPQFPSNCAATAFARLFPVDQTPIQLQAAPHRNKASAAAPVARETMEAGSSDDVIIIDPPPHWKRRGKEVDDKSDVRAAKKAAAIPPQHFNPVPSSPTMQELAIDQQLQALREVIPYWRENQDMPSDAVSTLKATVEYISELHVKLQQRRKQVAELKAETEIVGNTRQRPPATPKNTRMQTSRGGRNYNLENSDQIEMPSGQVVGVPNSSPPVEAASSERNQLSNEVLQVCSKDIWKEMIDTPVEDLKIVTPGLD